MADIYRASIARVELDGDLVREHVGSLLATGDKLANRYGVEVYRYGVPVSIGSMALVGYFIRPEADTVVINGTTSGNTGYVELPQSCYTQEGAFTLALKLSGGDVVQTVRVLDGRIILTQEGDLIDPGTTVPTLDDILGQIAACEAATEAAEALTSFPQGTLSGDYTVTIANDVIRIDTSSGFARVLCNGQYTTPTADVYALAKQDVYHHYVIVYKGGGFEFQPASVYSGAADADAVCVGVVYYGEDGTLETYHINGEVTDKVADEEAEIAMREAANQFGMIGGNYTITVDAENVVIDASSNLMRVLMGNKWQYIDAEVYTFGKPDNVNHGVIFCKDGRFDISAASNYVDTKTADKVAVGVVYWDANEHITKYHINGKVNDQRSPNYGGEVIRDVHQWGAMGDGVTDDTDAIQAALDACANGILYFPNGNYMITRTLYIHSNTHIMGNKGYTAIKLLPQEANELDELEWRPEDGRNKFPAVRTDDDSTGCIIEGIVFEGDSTYFHDLQQNGLYITGSHHVIRDCQFINWNYFPDKWEGRKENASAWGLAICHATHIKVEDCYCNRNGYEGAGTEFSYQVDFRGCYFGAAMRTGLQIHRASARISLEGCVLNNNVDSDNPLGDYATMTFHGAEGALIDGVKIVNCDFRHRHIQCVMGYERNVQITNCRVYSDSGYFVVITMGASGDIPQNEGWQIVGNEFYSTKSDGQTVIAMNVDKSIVSDNILHTNAATPIAMVGEANHAADNLIIRIVSSGTPESYVYPAASGGGSEYTLPTASATTKGGVKVGSGLQMSGEVLQVEPDTGYQLIESITVEEDVQNIIRTKEPDGTPYNFDAVHIRLTSPDNAAENRRLYYAIGNTASEEIWYDADRLFYVSSGSSIKEGGNSTEELFCEKVEGIFRGWIIPGAIASATISLNSNHGVVREGTVKAVRIFAFANTTNLIPAGTKIEIWGVRA